MELTMHCHSRPAMAMVLSVAKPQGIDRASALAKTRSLADAFPQKEKKAKGDWKVLTTELSPWPPLYLL